ncbi:PaaI family thioesterase [Terasakiella pusilla]|uniref:PaaI family thioesterase n=1 Tax=Terasakiella pusilla TaxID=64973 RepID=UPI003AA95BD1
MAEFTPKADNYIQLVQDAFAKQGFMQHLGVELAELKPGYCELHLPFKPELDQHHGYFHGGAIGALADVSGGFAGFTLLPEGQAMLTVEYKLNIISPGAGEYLKGVGRVIKHGRTLTITQIDVYGVTADGEKHCATAIQTLMAVNA